ncbi:hypothetical protein ALI144C_05305 [Actinosynnema sp. ALI-1.44]|uniref:hypothetical protein n=1 Tax=Actinosynnema sp. ALI-1.44 TaxID=1933779 RepID=UPI00097C967D|nr:hypothetical protein [Actinosynnema sp. ALI-1.44]ONI89359.1 hypothetical protein ALI144C_05305 [Actinosynnema sp. ALI-1.44]
MTVVDWVASDTASWIFFGIGVLTTALAIVGNRLIAGGRQIPVVAKGLSVWSPAVVGPLLLLGGVVLAGTGVGRLSWLSIFSGAFCLLVFAYLVLLENVHAIRHWRYVALRWSSEDSEHLARMISAGVNRELFDTVRPDLHSLVLAVHAALAPRMRMADSFDDFANSMVRSGFWAPVSVYTDADNGSELKDAVSAVLREFGLTSAVEEPPVRGSWFQRFWAQCREVIGSRSVRGRLAKVEEAIHLEYLGKRRAEIDKAKAESVAMLLAAMKEQQNAVIRIGSIIAIKTQGDLVVWTISEMQAAALEKNSDLLGDPVAALKFLREGEQTQESTSLEPPT